MKREQFDVAAPLIDRMDKLEKTIFKLQEIMNKKNYAILASDEDIIYVSNKLADVYSSGENIEQKQYRVILDNGEIATEIFIQEILEYYINTLNLELNELRKSLEEI